MKTNCLYKIKLVCILAICMVLSTQIFAQTDTKPKFNKFGLGLRLNHLYDVKFTAYDQLGNGFSGEDASGLNGSKTKFDLAYGLDLIYFVSPLISIDAAFDKGTMTGANSLNYYESDVNFLSLGLNYALKGRYKKEPYKFVPFLRASLSRGQYDTKLKFIEDGSPVVPNPASGATMMVGLGAGVRYHLNDNWHLNFQSEFVTIFTDEWDGYNYGSGKDHMLKTSLALRYTFGKQKHRDRAIAWQFSEQKNVPAAGMANNNDLKAVLDSLRSLRSQIIKLKIEDNILNEKLYKDSDLDGVPDIKDLCPTEKGNLPNGCNGSEVRSLVVNTNALAPVVANKTLDNAAVASTDNSNFKSDLSKELSKVYFRFNSSKLNPESKEILRNAAYKLKSNPSLNVTILGYADQVGTDEANTKISETRAKNVAEFLIKNGVDKGNIDIKVMGKQFDYNNPDALYRKVEILIK